jgi:hypothetical protein
MKKTLEKINEKQETNEKVRIIENSLSFRFEMNDILHGQNPDSVNTQHKHKKLIASRPIPRFLHNSESY